MHFFFGLAITLNGLGLSFFYYYPTRINIIIIDPTVDFLIWVGAALGISALVAFSSRHCKRGGLQRGLAVLAIVLCFAALATFSYDYIRGTVVCFLFVVICAELWFALHNHEDMFGLQPRVLLLRALVYLFAFFGLVEITSATHYVIAAFDRSTQLGTIDSELELQFAYAAGGLLPWLYAGFLFSWAWIPIVLRLPIRGIFGKGSNSSANPPAGQTEQKDWRTVILDPRLVLALAVAVFIGFYPYFQSPPWLVGTDAYWRYYNPLVRMNGQGVFGGFTESFREWHPALLMLLYSTQLAFQATPFQIVKFAPLFLTITMGFLMWWFIAKKKTITFGIIVFLSSVLSVTTTLGFYTGILANWMALVGWVAFLAYLSFRGERLGGFDFAILLGISTLVLILHPWTWGIFALSVVVCALLGLIQERRRGVRTVVLLISVVLIDALFALLSIKFLAESQGQGVMNALDLYSLALSNTSLSQFWEALNWVTKNYAPFFSPINIAAGIVGVFVLLKTHLAAWRGRLVLSWLFVSAIGSIIVSPIGFSPIPTHMDTQLWRLLYLTPFQVTAPLAVMWLAELPKRYQPTQDYAPQLRSVPGISALGFGGLAAIAVGLLGVSLELRALLLLVALPVFTGLIVELASGQESRLLRNMILVLYILLTFNYAGRALSKLLIDPHN